MDSTTWVDTSLDLNLNSLFSLKSSEVPREFEGDDFSAAGFQGKASVKLQETSDLVGELKRMSSENKKLNEMLGVLCENYRSLEKQYMDLMMSKSTENEIMATSKKRKAESEDYISNMIGFNGHTECSSTDEDQSCKRPKENMKTKVSRVCVRTGGSNSTLIVKDGYQWRKYGQKVTRDNPSPRAYFKCSFAPSCPVKKKVQRSVEDPSVLVATYEGEHNHPRPAKAELSSSPIHGATLGSIPAVSGSASMLSMAGATNVTLDMIQSPATGLFDDAKKSVHETEAPAIQEILVQQMASSLTRDPKFTAALAAAISGRFVEQARAEKLSL